MDLRPIIKYFAKPKAGFQGPSLYMGESDNAVSLVNEQDIPQNNSLNEWNSTWAANQSQYYGYDGIPPGVDQQFRDISNTAVTNEQLYQAKDKYEKLKNNPKNQGRPSKYTPPPPPQMPTSPYYRNPITDPFYPTNAPTIPDGYDKMGYTDYRRDRYGRNPAPHRDWWMRYRYHRMPAIRRPAVDYASNHWFPPREIPLEVYNYPGYQIVEYPVPKVRYYWPIR